MLKVFVQVLSLFCVALGQPAFFPWLAPFAASLGLALHWKCLDGLSLKAIGRVSFLWLFAVQLIQTSWIADLQYQGVYILVVYVCLSAGIAWQFAFTTKMLHRNPQLRWLSMAMLASCWTLFEWMRLHVLCGFAFNFLGVALSWHPLPLQMASIFGVLGLSFWAFLTNLSLYRGLKTPSLRLLGIWAFLAAVPYLYGFFHLNWHETEEITSERHHVLLVQTALSPSQKYSLKGKESDFIAPLDQWKKILNCVGDVNGRRLDLLVLPEAAVAFGLDLCIYDLEEIQRLCRDHLGESVHFPPSQPPFGYGRRVANAYLLQTLASNLNARVLAGLDYQDETGAYYNSAFYFEPEIGPIKRYDKRILLPLAESRPFPFLASLSRYYGIKDFFSEGKVAQVFGAPLFLSPSICYEELFPSLIREGKKLGAELFVNLTNDGWYPASKLPLQHFTHGLIRSVENGIPLVRACNTGVTSAVDSFGRVIGILQGSDGDVERVSGGLWVEVPKKTHVTGFSLWGEIPLLVLCFCFVVIGAFGTFREKLFVSLRILKKNSLKQENLPGGNSS